ncbi:MAG TPA: M55 family metallopeptidase [Vicinamibacterales bacterium]|nr:M55 family metallopeptidase [Vicinamibacterales bacterium]
MSRFAIASIALCLAAIAVGPPLGSQQAPLKVFISVDMEGLAGVVAATDVSPTGRDYAHFRAIMAAETNAAIEGAAAAGATEFVVRDSHGDKTNLLPGDVDHRAVLIRGASTGPKNMMEGIDGSFGAVIFVGYHAKAGTPNAILEHTSNGNVIDISINGTSLPEGGYNALVAGLHNVPVVFAAGDRALTEQLTKLLGPIETVAVKEEIGGDASRGLSMLAARNLIRSGVERGVRKRAQLKPFTMAAPYTMVLKVRQEKPPYKGAERTGPGEFRFTSPDLLEVLNAFNAMK